MGYALLWIENLATTLLLTALLVAVIARVRWFGRLLAGLILVLLFLVFYASPTIGTGMMRYSVGIVTSPFGFFLSLSILVTLGAVTLLVIGFRRRPAEGLRTAQTWPLGRLGLAAAVALALQMMTFWNLDMEVKSRLSALRAEAGAIALSNAPARLPDSQNAALVYRQAFELLPKDTDFPEVWRQAWQTDGNMWTPELLNDPTIAAFLERQQRTLNLLRRAAAMPGCYFEHEYGLPTIDLLLPELGEWRHGMGLLELDARYQTAHAQSAAALRDVAAMFGMSRHANTEPMLIGYLVAVSIDSRAKQTLETVLTSTPFSADDLAVLALDDSTSLIRDMQRAFAMEEAFGLSFFCELGGDRGLNMIQNWTGAPSGPGGLLPSRRASPAAALYRVFLLSDDVEGYRDVMRTYRGVLALPHAKMLAQLAPLDRKEFLRSHGVFTGIIAPALGSALRTGIQAEAGHRTAQVGLALARYRAAHNGYPDKLEDLVPQFLPAVPQDPYDDQPLRYHGTPQNVVVYSIGPDLKNDQGATFDHNKKTGDITFTLKR